MISSLKTIKAVSVIREFETDGHTPLWVIGDDYKKYVVKNTRGRCPDFHILNEILCHYLLKEWGINTPDIALIEINPFQLPEGLSPKNKAIYFDGLCFASQFIEDAIETNSFTSIIGKVDYRKIHNPQILFLLALFDIWVENDDRKPTNNNLLLAPNSGSKIITAFDHAFVFSTIDYTQLDPKYVNSSYNESILLSSLGQSVMMNTKIDANWIQDIKDKYYLCVDRCKKNYQHIINRFPESMGFDINLQNKIYEFLFNEERNKNVFNEFLSRLN